MSHCIYIKDADMLSYNCTKNYGLNHISLTNWDNVTFNHELHWSYVLIFLIKFNFPLKNLKFIQL